MDSTYGEFQGTDLDPSADWDFDDDFEDEGNDLLPILGASVALAAVVGGILVLVGRRRNPTPGERIQDAITQLDKRGKKVAGRLEKSGSKGVAAVQQATSDGKLRDLLGDAIVYSRHRASDAGQAVEDLRLAEALEEARDRARKAAARIDLHDTGADVSKGVQKGVRQGVKKARRQLRDLAALEAAQVALDRARKSASSIDVGDLADEARKRAGDVADETRKRAGDVADSVRDTDIDPKGALGTLRERVATVVEAVREDLAPKAVDTAQSAVDKVREDVIPATQDRVSQLVEETGIDEKAAKAAKSARKGAESLSDVLRTILAALVAKLVDEILPEARQAGNRAVKTAREDVIPAVADTAGDVAQKVKEDVLPRVGEAAEKTPDMLSDLLKMARERADEVLERAQPVASDAAEFSRHRAGDFAEFSKHRAEDVADALHGSKNGLTGAVSDVKDTAASVGGGITGGISSAGKGVKSAVGGAVDTTTRTTKELGAIAFWLAMLGGLILLVFVPDRDKQQEMWNSVRQFLGEVREMWRDLQGEDYELETPETGGE